MAILFVVISTTVLATVHKIPFRGKRTNSGIRKNNQVASMFQVKKKYTAPYKKVFLVTKF